jgi:pimeloyl-ACP methyl ester carboxylesterase
MSLQGTRITANGIDMNVYLEGSGTPLLLLHGFPDSNALWRHVIPSLVASGYRVIAPDLRGFGETEAPVGVAHYRIETVVRDAVALLDELDVPAAHVVGHDWGAVAGWFLAGWHSDRLLSFTAVSVGHPRAYANAGWEQKRKGWYTLFFQLRGLAERVLSGNDWKWFRHRVRDYAEAEQWIADLSRPGRLTAGLNWYRANLSTVVFGRHPRCPVPTMGIWSSRDIALSEDQMRDSIRYVDNTWRYERIDDCSHWIPLDAPRRLSGLILDFIGGLKA